MASNFFTNLRRSTRVVKTGDVDGIANLLRASSSFDSNLQMMLRNGTFDIHPTTKRVRMNGTIDLARADNLLRRGELRTFGKETNNLNISSRAESGFRTSMRDTTPDLRLRELDESIVNARRAHSDLNVTPSPGETSADFRARLTPDANNKLDGVLQKIKALGGASLVVGGVVVVFIVGVDLLQSLIDATNNRRGCFEITRVNSSRTTSCRILARTCWQPQEPVCDDNHVRVIGTTFPTNITLMLHVALNNTPLRNEIETLIGEEVTLDSIPVILDNSDHVLTLSEFHLTNEISVPTPCMGGVTAEVPLCRACNFTLAPTDPGFVDLSEINERTTLTCIPSSSILDSIVDISIGNGVDLLRPFGQISNSGSGSFIFFTLILVLFIIIAAVVFSLVNKKK